MLKDLLAQRRKLNKQIRKEALNLAVGGAIKGGKLIGTGVVNGAKAVAKVPGALWTGAKIVGKGGFTVARLAVGGAIKGGKLIGTGVVNGAKAVAKVPGALWTGAKTVMGGKNLAKNIGKGIANGSRAAAGAIMSAGKTIAKTQMVKTAQRYTQTGVKIFMENMNKAMR